MDLRAEVPATALGIARLIVVCVCTTFCYHLQKASMPNARATRDVLAA
jgi:hypothetical protein